MSRLLAPSRDCRCPRGRDRARFRDAHLRVRRGAHRASESSDLAALRRGALRAKGQLEPGDSRSMSSREMASSSTPSPPGRSTAPSRPATPANGEPPPIVYTADLVRSTKSLELVVEHGIAVNCGSPDMIDQYGARVSGRRSDPPHQPGLRARTQPRRRTPAENRAKHGIWHEASGGLPAARRASQPGRSGSAASTFTSVPAPISSTWPGSSRWPSRTARVQIVGDQRAPRSVPEVVLPVPYRAGDAAR